MLDFGHEALENAGDDGSGPEECEEECENAGDDGPGPEECEEECENGD